MTIEKLGSSNIEFKNLTKNKIESLFKKGFIYAIETLSEIIFSFQKYDSITSYNLLFNNLNEEQIKKNAISILKNWDPKTQIENKYGQDCYDVIFMLIRILPYNVNPKILATKNKEHNTEGQLQKFKFYHFSISVTDPNTGEEYLLDWTNKPIKLIEGENVFTKNGDKISVRIINQTTVILNRDLYKKDTSRQMEYQYINSEYNIVDNFKKFLRTKERVNQITKRLPNNAVIFMRYDYVKKGFKNNISGVPKFVTNFELDKFSELIDKSFGKRITSDLIRFTKIHQILSDNFWI